MLWSGHGGELGAAFACAAVELLLFAPEPSDLDCLRPRGGDDHTFDGFLPVLSPRGPELVCVVAGVGVVVDDMARDDVDDLIEDLGGFGHSAPVPIARRRPALARGCGLRAGHRRGRGRWRVRRGSVCREAGGGEMDRGDDLAKGGGGAAGFGLRLALASHCAGSGNSASVVPAVAGGFMGALRSCRHRGPGFR